MKRFLVFFGLIGCLFLSLLSLTACKSKIDYFAYLSENRSNILVAEGEDYRLKIYAVDKEYPYCTDGFIGEVTSRAEIYLSVKNGGDTCRIAFKHDGHDVEGEMSYDSVTGEYFFSCAANIKEATQLTVDLQHGENKWQTNALTVKDQNTLSSKQVLTSLLEKSKSTFDALTKEKTFEGEIYLRLIYESAPYYYVGITGRDKKTTAFLIDAVSGNILATKQN